MFITKTSARKNMNKKFDSPNIIDSINKFNDSNLERLPHSDTNENFYKNVNVE